MIGSPGIAYERVTRALAAKAVAGGWEPPDEGGNWRCPAHDDHNPSLSVTNGDGKAKLHCHANCSVNDVVEALGLELKDLFDKTGERPDRPQIAATYAYTDANGELLFQVVRYTPKTFRQRQPDGKGGWIWNLQDTPRVLYHLPDVIIAVKEDLTIYVVEGEKDADALVGAGVVATTCPAGAGKWRSEYTDTLNGAAEIIVVADRDQPGYDHARQVAQALRPHVGKVAVVEAATGKDVSDHLVAGHTVDELRPIGDQQDEPAGTDSLPQLHFITAAELAAEIDAARPVGYLARPVWPADAHGVVAATGKAGKTWAASDLTVSVASGQPWLGAYPVERPGRVVAFLGEGGKRKMLRRMRAVCAFHGVNFEDLPIDLCLRVPHLTDAAHLADVKDHLAVHPDTVLVIVDPLYLAAKGAKGASLYDMATVLEPLQLLTQQAGCALAFVHHWNQTGRGTGAERMSGAGPMEWGRVLISVAVKAKSTDPTTRATAVTLDWHFEGDEIPDSDLRVRRKVWADDPDDLSSPMHYELETIDRDTDPATSDELATEKIAVRRVAAILDTTSEMLTVRQIGDQLANDGTGIPLKPRTIQDALSRLRDLDRAVDDIVPSGRGQLRWAARTASAHTPLTKETKNAP